MMPTTVSETKTTRSFLKILNIYIPWTQTLSLSLNTQPSLLKHKHWKGEAMQVHALQRQAHKVKVLQIEHKLSQDRKRRRSKE